MRFGSAFGNWDFLPIAGVAIATLFFVLYIPIVSSRRNYDIVVGLIWIAAGARWLLGITLRFRRHRPYSEFIGRKLNVQYYTVLGLFPTSVPLKLLIGHTQ
jgi:hypothetical protein